MSCCRRRLAAAILISGLFAAGGVVVDAAPVAIYDNTGTVLGVYSGQGGNETIEDIHAFGQGPLSGVTLGYEDPDLNGGAFSAEVRVYRNPGGLDQDIIPLGGPYFAHGLSRGRHVVHVPIPDGPQLESHFWVGVRFTSPTAGLLVSDPPGKGSSHDHYVENGQFFFFGGDPPANFCLKVEVDLGSIGVGGEPAAGLRFLTVHPHPARSGLSRLGFRADQDGRIAIRLYDAQGRLVRTLLDEVRPAGEYEVRFPADLGPGVYFTRMTAGNFRASLRIVVLD